jgi:hypothetical protein
MKDPKDPGTGDLWDDNQYRDLEAEDSRLDRQVKEWLFNSETKKFEVYNPRTRDNLEGLKEWYERWEEE